MWFYLEESHNILNVINLIRFLEQPFKQYHLSCYNLSREHLTTDITDAI